MAYAQSTAMIATPIGTIIVEAAGERLSAIRIGRPKSADETGETTLLREARAQLNAYFAGELKEFDLPLLPAATQRGGALREAITAIGYGDTLGYGALARQIGSSARAIGQACARNPYPLVVPCHRVLSAGARLGHYSAGDGPLTKAWLLSHEGATEWQR